MPVWQVAPVWQVVSAQHGCPTAPHAAQLPCRQTASLWQAGACAQQGWPTPPQVDTQVPPWQTAGFAQKSFGAQQGWLAAPHGTQVFMLSQVKND
jgi:hypothetical protein